MTNKCYLCGKLDRFYTKGKKQFNKAKCGWCMEQQRVVDINDGCDKFVLRKKPARINPTIILTLNNILTELSAVRAVIEEESSIDEKL